MDPSTQPPQAQRAFETKATGHVKNVIDQYGLIPRATSHELLRRSIGLNGHDRRDDEFSVLDEQAIDRLRGIYKRYQVQASDVPNAPRYLPFYLALRDRFPEIDWDVRVVPQARNLEHRQVVLQLPELDGVAPSLAALLLQDLPPTALHVGPRIAPELEGLPSTLIDELQTLLDEARVVLRKGDVLRDLGPLLSKGLAGETIHVLCPVCPDYANEQTGNPEAPYRYTFSGLGDEPGLVAERLLADLPRFADFFARNGIKVRFVIGQADFEVLSEDTVQQVGVDVPEFLRRMTVGGQKIADRVKNLPVDTLFISDLCGGLEGWRVLHADMRERLAAVHRGDAPAARSIDWQGILEARRPLYERWVGPRDSLNDYLPFLLNQGAEYAGLGEIARSLSETSFMLCCDHHAMTPFYKIVRDVPVVYLKRNYA